VIQKKSKFSVTRCFFGHFKFESRVTPVAWADAYPSIILVTPIKIENHEDQQQQQQQQQQSRL
jgi:hypothetical protein